LGSVEPCVGGVSLLKTMPRVTDAEFDAKGHTLDDLLARLSDRDREFVLSFVRDYVAHHGKSR